MDAEYALPFFAKTGWIVGIFVAALFIFHLVLVRRKNLSKIGWKKVDYYWLAVGAFGIFAAVETPRSVIAGNLLDLAESRMTGAVMRLNTIVQIGEGPGYCRTFVRSEFSPPPAEFERLQKEYDSMCQWFKEVSRRLPKKAEDVQKPIGLEGMTAMPDIGESITWLRGQLTESIDGVNQQLAVIEELRAVKKKSEWEKFLQLTGPFLLSIALALRITKVTGEIKHEK